MFSRELVFWVFVIRQLSDGQIRVCKKLKQQQEEYGVYEVSDDDDDAAEFRYMSEWVTSNNDDLKRLCFRRRQRYIIL